MDRMIVKVNSRWRYPVIIGSKPVSQITSGLVSDKFVFIVDSRVNNLYPNLFTKSSESLGITGPTIIFPGGEKHKTTKRIFSLFEQLLNLGIGRRDNLIAVGGGTIIDAVGFLASIYMRGVPYINIPTTLMGQVDASIGGKTAVNIFGIKNICGSFYQPKAVFVDVSFLKTLSLRHLHNGLAEVIKVATISSPELFEFVEDHLQAINNRDLALLEPLVVHATQLKISLLGSDSLENNLDRSLNFGHTLGHAIELMHQSKLLHGEAISIGMAVSTRIALKRGIIDKSTADRILELQRRVGLPVTVQMDSAALELLKNNLSIIKSIRGGALRYVLPSGIGSVIIENEIAIEEIYASLSG